MTQRRSFQFRFTGRSFGALLVASGLTMAASGGAVAKEQESPVNRVLSSSVAEQVNEALEDQQAQNFSAMATGLTSLLGEQLEPYEAFVVYQLRGRARFEMDDLQGAIADFNAMLATGAATVEERNTWRVQLGQLHIATDNLDRGLIEFEAAVRDGIELDPAFLRLLSRAYYQAERYRDGVGYAERYYESRSVRSQADYALMQAYYKQLNQTEDEMRVIEAALADFPDERSNWQNLVAILARQDMDADAFEANKLMYLNGLFQQCSEIYRLAQYFSYYDNPYRGATLLERAINTSRCDGDVEQLETLANMWRQAREFDRGVAVIERLANQTGDANWYAKLGETYFELNNLAGAEAAFDTAIELGDLDQPGTVLALLGTVRFQNGDLNASRAAFLEATRYDESRAEAQAWLIYVDARINVTGVSIPALVLQECQSTIANEVRIATLVGQADESGRVPIPVPEHCWPYFNDYGDQIGTVDEPADVTGRITRAPT